MQYVLKILKMAIIPSFIILIVGCIDPNLLNISSIDAKAEARSIALLVDSSANSYLIGTTAGVANSNEYFGMDDVFVTKYNSNFELQWTKLYGSSYNDVANKAILTSDDQIVIIGYTGGDFETNPTCCGITRGFVLSVDLNGDKNWSTYFGPSTEISVNSIMQNPNTSLDDVAFDSNLIYVVGSSLADIGGNGSLGNSDLFISKLALDGTVSQTLTFGTADSENPYRLAIANSQLVINSIRTTSPTETYAFDSYIIDFDFTGLTPSAGSTTTGTPSAIIIRANQNSLLYEREVTDGVGNVYTITASTSHILQVVKKNSSLVNLWTQSWDFSAETPSVYYLSITGVAITAEDKLELSFIKDYASNVNPYGVSQSNWILRLNADGTQSNLFIW